MPTNLLDELRAALKGAHEALLEPPPDLKEDPETLAKWKPAVRTHVDWGELGCGKGDGTATGVPENSQEVAERKVEPVGAADQTDKNASSKEHLEDKFLTIGLIGTYRRWTEYRN